jgi:MoaA/NifB/PqqE/SkfB family radical SAM enzyme
MEKGAVEKAIEMARKSLDKGLSIDLVVELTGFSKEEIEKL